jgi:hypothetical protein
MLMDLQLKLYAAAMAENGRPVHAVIYNQLNTYEYKNKENIPPDKLFRREPNYLNQAEIQNVLLEVGHAVDEMQDAHGRVVRRRMRRDCSMCRYQDPCLAGLKGMDMHDVLPANFKRPGDNTEMETEDVEIHL